MSLTITYAGKIQKAEFRQVGEKSVCQVSVCEKKYNKDKNADPEYDWIEASIWDAPEFLAAKLKKGNFITFSGTFATRKYTDKAGVEKKNMECRCDTRNVTVVDAGFFGERQEQSAAPAPAPRRPAAPAGGGADPDDSPPFARRCEWE
jgi:single-stranded DNA-binding protein